MQVLSLEKGEVDASLFNGLVIRIQKSGYVVNSSSLYSGKHGNENAVRKLVGHLEDTAC